MQPVAARKAVPPSCAAILALSPFVHGVPPTHLHEISDDLAAGSTVIPPSPPALL